MPRKKTTSPSSDLPAEPTLEPDELSDSSLESSPGPSIPGGTVVLDEILKEAAEEPGIIPQVDEWTEIALEDPLEILEDPTIALELSEDPVRLYLKEIGQIRLLDADSEFRLAARIEAERLVISLQKLVPEEEQLPYHYLFSTLIRDLYTA